LKAAKFIKNGDLAPGMLETMSSPQSVRMQLFNVFEKKCWKPEKINILLNY
jgi:hypothetical protein